MWKVGVYLITSRIKILRCDILCIMASEKSSLLDRNYSTNAALSVPITSENPRPLREDASTSVANPFTNKRAGEATSTLDSSTIEASTHHQLTSSDPREILFALERAADLLRGQVEEDEQVHRVRKRPLLPVWLTNHLLLITFLIQVVGVGVLEIFHAVSGLDGTNTTEADAIVVDSGDGVLCLIELIHLLVVVVVSFKLVKQVIHHTATGVFLAQCYLSTVLLFAGLYTFEFRISPSAWDNLNANKATHPTFVYLKMLYFSVSTATLCGTSVIEPVSWFSYLTSGVQMLLSFVYFASILSVSIVPRRASKFNNKHRKERSLTSLIRKAFIFLCCCCRSWTVDL